MTVLNTAQLACLTDLQGKGRLARPVASVDFDGGHKGQTIKSLIDKNIITQVSPTQGYPLVIEANPDHLVNKNLFLLGRSVAIRSTGGGNFSSTIEGFALKNNQVFVRIRIGGYTHRPLTDVIESVK